MLRVCALCLYSINEHELVHCCIHLISCDLHCPFMAWYQIKLYLFLYLGVRDVQLSVLLEAW